MLQLLCSSQFCVVNVCNHFLYCLACLLPLPATAWMFMGVRCRRPCLRSAAMCLRWTTWVIASEWLTGHLMILAYPMTFLVGMVIMPSQLLHSEMFGILLDNYRGIWSMFPLSCASVRAHTGREMSTHKKTWSADKFYTHFIHVVLNIDECW